MEHFKRYYGVTPESKVEVDVKPCDGSARIKAKLISATQVDTWLPCSQPNPTAPLRAKKNYFTSVRLDFVASQTVTVTIRVVAPNGTVHSTPWVWKITGKNGQSALVGGFIQVS